MRGIINLMFLVFMIKISHPMFYSDVAKKVMSFLEKAAKEDYQKQLTSTPYIPMGLRGLTPAPIANTQKSRKRNDFDPRAAMKMFKTKLKDTFDKHHMQQPNYKHLRKQMFRKDPILNYIKRRNSKEPGKSFRRKSANIFSDDSTIETSSSSLEEKHWKDEWREIWIQKKFEAINSSLPKGDVVNMVAARPWGVPCGDPDQHDAPWGSCTLPMECEPEYRVYRGDYFCGRSQFVCCAIQQTTYDMYQAFDVSFADSNLSTDSEEKKNRSKGSKEKNRKRRERKKRKRRNDRIKRKRKIKRNIRKIVREIRKILNKAYRNGTTARKRKTKTLKKYIKSLKQKYRNDRESVKEIHEIELIEIDKLLQQNLQKVKNLNEAYLTNSTIRDLIDNGTISKGSVRTLVSKYPQLKNYLDTRRLALLDVPAEKSEDAKKGSKGFLNYDLEYGLLYY